MRIQKRKGSNGPFLSCKTLMLIFFVSFISLISWLYIHFISAIYKSSSPIANASFSSSDLIVHDDDNMLPRVLAFVFPQFHQDALNDRLWGEGKKEKKEYDCVHTCTHCCFWLTSINLFFSIQRLYRLEQSPKCSFQK